MCQSCSIHVLLVYCSGNASSASTACPTVVLLFPANRWVNQLEEEFFRQGDVERQNGMTISPLFDRAKQGITKSQVGFFDIVIIPLFHTFGKVFNNCRPLLTYVMRNYRYWAGELWMHLCCIVRHHQLVATSEDL